jgi:ribosomal protein S18 acetylase RimI-like enzyme
MNLKPVFLWALHDATIRPGLIEELPCLCTMVSLVVRHMKNQGIDQWDELYPNQANLAQDLESRSLHVLEKAGEIMGFVVLNEFQSPEYETVPWRYQGRVLAVHRLTIAPACQRQRLGSLLMDFAEETAAAQGYECIRLDAFILNPPALSLYEQRGYRKAGVVRFRKGDFYCFEKRVEHSETNVDFYSPIRK